jgi:hypothetical protein
MKENNIVNILLQGGWLVGQGAIIAWLRGFEEVKYVTGGFPDGEHEMFRKEDGILDLLSLEDNNKKLELLKRMQKRALAGIIKIIGSNILYHPIQKINTSTYFLLYHYLRNEKRKLKRGKIFNEIEYWKEWLVKFNNIGHRIDYKKNQLALYLHHNPFFYSENFSAHEKTWPQFFSPYKLIFIHRNSIDQFADVVKNNAYIITTHHRFWNGTEYLSAIDRYFEICKRIYSARLRMAKEYSPGQLLIVSFEDFILKHEQVAHQIKSFLGIQSNYNPNNKHFTLEQSRKNIGIGKNNSKILGFLDEKPYILEELNSMYRQLDMLPHTVH